MSSEILVVDDDPAIAEMLTVVMKREGFDTIVVDGGLEAAEAVEQENPDLILLNLMLPGMSGVDVYRTVREISAVLIIMLTAKADMVDVVLGLEPGADDYVTKPFKPKELVVRIRARLRCQGDNPSETLEVDDLIVDVPGHAMFRDDKEVSLTLLESDLLHAPASRPKQILSRDELSEKVRGYQYTPDTRLVNVHVQRLRSKIELDSENPQIVLTARGAGYKTGDQSRPVNSSGSRFLRRLVTKLRDSTNRGVIWAVTLWRTSIQARILASVVILSAMVVAVLGLILATIMTQQSIDAKVTAADKETDRVRAVVERATENSSSNELQALFDAGRDALVNRAAGSGAAPLTSYEPLLLAPMP